MASQPQALLGKKSRGPEPLAGKAKIMAAQRGSRLVEAVVWRPSCMPRAGEPTGADFVLGKAKLVARSKMIEDDAFVALAAPPKVLFDSAVGKLAHYDGEVREEGFNVLTSLASEGSHALSCEARYYCGECYLNGRGCLRDPVKAARWFATVRPVAWPVGLVHSPNNAQAQAQFLLGDLYEYGGIGSGATQAVGGGVFRPDPHKALGWYARAAMRGHPLAALSCGEMLAQSGGRCARNPGVNFETMGAHQARRIAKAGSAVAVQREGWRLAYSTDATNPPEHIDTAARRARSYFEEVLQLTGPNPPADREKLHWEKHWKAKLANQKLAELALKPLPSTQALANGINTPTPMATARSSSSRQQQRPVPNVTTPVTGGGGPADWPQYRCRAYLGLATLAQEGLGTTGPPSMPRAFRYLIEALKAVNDTRALELLSYDDATAGRSSRHLGYQTTAGSHHSEEPQAGATNVLFSVALCYHFGRGIAQDLSTAQRLYKEFLRRGIEDASVDEVASHPPWRGLCQQLKMHAEQLEERQGAYFSKAAALLES